MKSFILNGLSLNMLSSDVRGLKIIPVGRIEEDMAYDETGMDIFHFDGSVSAIGHADTALLIAKTFHLNPEVVAFNRQNIQLKPGDRALIFSYSGPRLPEGASLLPEGAKIIPQVVVAY